MALVMVPIENTEDEVVPKGENERLRAAISWALGYTNFKARGEGDPAFWWRGELRERSGLTDEVLRTTMSPSVDGDKADD